ncbi:MAG: hypothetical protein JNL38_02085 [Myxococcales bacterium]|nr:hypothetical protein [Myxococcales bacterium]
MSSRQSAAPFVIGRRGALALPWAIGVAALGGGCRSRGIAFEYDGGRAFSREERAAIERCAEGAVAEVRPLLPALATRLVLRVSAGTDVIPETGETATAYPPDAVAWVVDATREGAVIATARAQLRFTLFHELHHLVRDAALPRRSLLDHVVAEGLATAFERDSAGAKPAWGEYPEGAARWVKELEALPPKVDVSLWLYGRHPDGRRWVGLRAGTYLADRATRALGKTAAELVTTPTSAILEAAARAPG